MYYVKGLELLKITGYTSLKDLPPVLTVYQTPQYLWLCSLTRRKRAIASSSAGFFSDIMGMMISSLEPE
ncbi:MAG: hypothetical protein ACM34I_06690 [bacterium]